jgi:hypothetical protein
LSRKLNVASVLLFIVGAWFIFEGLMALFSTEMWVSGWMTMVTGDLFPPSVSEIQAFSQGLWGFMLYVNQFVGLYALLGSLLFCIIALVPYRKGEKWAWYTMLLVGGFLMVVGGILVHTGMPGSFSVIVHPILVILWIIGLALPAKEISSK